VLENQKKGPPKKWVVGNFEMKPKKKIKHYEWERLVVRDHRANAVPKRRRAGGTFLSV
jgi:hypothetical protein